MHYSLIYIETASCSLYEMMVDIEYISSNEATKNV